MVARLYQAYREGEKRYYSNLICVKPHFVLVHKVSRLDFEKYGMCDQQSLRSAWEIAQSD